MLRLRQSDFDDIRRHGEEAYPLECCGVLLGSLKDEGRTVHATIRCANAEPESPATRYAIDAREAISVQSNARERGLEIVGFYHSHPDHQARWSPTDLEQAYWLGCSYVITEVQKGRAGHTASYVLTGRDEEDKAFTEEEVVVE